MDFNLACFSDYEASFLALAEAVEPWEGSAKPVLSAMPLFLCLYGENGLTPEAEFEALEVLQSVYEQTPERVMKLEIEASNHYWQETILFLLP
ncbi:MAG: hypothetical protein NTW61_06100 [Candidatus Melainabacteria bacterium]|jgi:hypothetical protein|nr:hypothetical protein [Candidatus Melainabacteria bacterium]